MALTVRKKLMLNALIVCSDITKANFRHDYMQSKWKDPNQCMHMS